jgi:hypothetical protein
MGFVHCERRPQWASILVRGSGRTPDNGRIRRLEMDAVVFAALNMNVAADAIFDRPRTDVIEVNAMANIFVGKKQLGGGANESYPAAALIYSERGDEK